MQNLPSPLPTAAQQAFVTAIRKAVTDLVGHLPDGPLSDDERRSLNARTMGPETLGFVTDANQLMQSFPAVLPRTITDGTISEFPARIEQFQGLSLMVNEVMAAVRPLTDARLLVGVHLRATSRDVHAAGRRDAGKTPGVKEVVARLDAHTDRPEESASN